MFKIELATEADIPAIIDIAEQTWWQAYSKILSASEIRYMLDSIYAPEILRSQIIDSDQTYLVLSEESMPNEPVCRPVHRSFSAGRAGGGMRVGFASFGQRPEDPQVYKIHKLYVLPGDQKRGYGKALIGDITRRLQEKNIGIADLNVNRFNPARHFYEKLGFRIIREEDVPIGPYWMNDYVMRLEL